MTFEISQVVITIVVVCLFLWRIYYGADNGLFAEAAGLIAVLAAFAAVYFMIQITGNVLHTNFGDIIPKIGYLVVAFIVYKIMTSIGASIQKIKDVPVVGKLDKFMGAVLGVVEAYLIVKIIEYITNYNVFGQVIDVFVQLFKFIMALING